jgi:hypothetical protein
MKKRAIKVKAPFFVEVSNQDSSGFAEEGEARLVLVFSWHRYREVIRAGLLKVWQRYCQVHPGPLDAFEEPLMLLLRAIGSDLSDQGNEASEELAKCRKLVDKALDLAQTNPELLGKGKGSKKELLKWYRKLKRDLAPSKWYMEDGQGLTIEATVGNYQEATKKKPAKPCKSTASKTGTSKRRRPSQRR